MQEPCCQIGIWIWNNHYKCTDVLPNLSNILPSTVIAQLTALFFNFLHFCFRIVNRMEILETVRPTSHGTECSDQCKTHQVQNQRKIHSHCCQNKQSSMLEILCCDSNDVLILKFPNRTILKTCKHIWMPRFFIPLIKKHK